jgi:putative tryptophan/tyrosine transport system substrate-binding protein
VLLIGADPFLLQSSDRLIALAAQHRIPAVYNTREFVAGGGLISYGAGRLALAGVYAGRILKGARPAELPDVQPTKFELANARATKPFFAPRTRTVFTKLEYLILNHPG